MEQYAGKEAMMRAVGLPPDAPLASLVALFMLAGLRFVEDGTLAWTASWVASFQGALLERGA